MPLRLELNYSVLRATIECLAKIPGRPTFSPAESEIQALMHSYKNLKTWHELERMLAPLKIIGRVRWQLM